MPVRKVPQTVYLTDASLSQEALLVIIDNSIEGDAPENYCELFGRMFTAYVNDSLPLGVTWVPTYAVLMGPKDWAEPPTLDAFNLRLQRAFARFQSLMPGSNL